MLWVVAVMIAASLAIGLVYSALEFFPREPVQAVQTQTSSFSLDTANPPGARIIVRTVPGATTDFSVSYYEYNTTAPQVLKTLELISVSGWVQKQGEYLTFDAGNNFTITASPLQIEVGGLDNKNEGILVTYHLRPNSNTTGTYEISIKGVSLPKGLPGGIGCSSYGVIIVGNGVPNYAGPSTCWVVQMGPGQQYPSGYLFFRVE